MIGPNLPPKTMSLNPNSRPKKTQSATFKSLATSTPNTATVAGASSKSVSQLQAEVDSLTAQLAKANARISELESKLSETDAKTSDEAILPTATEEVLEQGNIEESS